jgi:hypothetical protein
LLLPYLVTVSELFYAALRVFSQSANMPDESGASQYQVLEELGSQHSLNLIYHTRY